MPFVFLVAIVSSLLYIFVADPYSICFPLWIVHFALHSLSLDPLPPTVIMVNCLLAITINLGCKVLRIRGLGARWVLTLPVS